jgi:hypothetical protein
LANAEAYIEQLLAENKNLNHNYNHSQITVAESAKVQSLTQELTETQNRLKAAEGEVQRIKKEL